MNAPKFASLLQQRYTDPRIEVAQASQEPTNGTHPEGAAEDDNAGGMWPHWDQGGVAVLRCSDSCIGLFQISVKLPHEPYKIQVMVRIAHVAVYN